MSQCTYEERLPIWSCHFAIPYENHRRGVKNPDPLDADKHFTLPDHNFNVNAVFNIIEQPIRRVTVSLATFKERLPNTKILNK